MFVVHRESESKPNMEFRMYESGLHYYDPRKYHHLTFVNTVSENKTGFANRQIKCAELARNLYKTLSYTSTKDFKLVINSNQIKDCPMTIQDIDVAMKIWGKIIAAHLADRTVPQIFKAFKEMYQYYLQRGFHIMMVHADGEFAPLKNLIKLMTGGPMVNLASANEHVPDTKRSIRVVKEQCWVTWHSLPFYTIPNLMTIHIVLNVVKLLIFFPTKGGVSDTLSPKTIMSGETLDYKKHTIIQLGQYCQVHEEDNPRNSQIDRTKEEISLGPSGKCNSHA
jgi:hypothetical protein